MRNGKRDSSSRRLVQSNLFIVRTSSDGIVASLSKYADDKDLTKLDPRFQPPLHIEGVAEARESLNGEGGSDAQTMGIYLF